MTFETPIGGVKLYEERGALVRLSLRCPLEENLGENALLLEGKRQLLAYFSGELRQFDLPFHPVGTPFQQSVWHALQTIPYGETRSYGQIGAQIGNPRGARAVGMANNKNPLPIFIPCHRVVGASGKLVGYAGGLDVKEMLLQMEGWNVASLHPIVSS